MDYNLKAIDETDWVDPGECYTLTGAAATDVPGLGWGTSSACQVYLDGDIIELAPGASKVKTIEIKGQDESVDPDSYDVRLVAVTKHADGSGHYPDEDNLPSDNLTVTGNDYDWTTGVSSDYGGLNSCAPGCDWYNLFVEIHDTPRANAAPTTCGDYVPEVELCINWEYMSQRMAPIYSECSAGSGRFQLMPLRSINRDHDSSRSVILLPVQKSGTGVMTAAAWINSIEVVEDQGQTLNVVKLNKDLSFDTGDALVNPSAKVYALTSTTTTFANGAVTGGAPFIIEEAAETTYADFSVDMEWSCGVLQEQEELTPPQGYTSSLADIECWGDWPQRFTIRPNPALNPTRVVIEMYGMLADRITVPVTAAIGGGYDFTYNKKLLDIAGTLNSYDPTTGASVTIDHIKIDGTSVCTAGTYTLPAEE